MAGNVWEWCQDWWHSNYDGAPTDGTAWEDPSGYLRVIRGDCWGNSADYCHSAVRDKYDPMSVGNHIGFRLVRVNI